MNTRPMSKEDNAVYASRSDVVRMAGAQEFQAKDARKSMKTGSSYVSAATSAIAPYENDYRMDIPHMTAVY